MKTHKLKIKDRYFREVVSGRKTFELRKDDRGYEVGDEIVFDIVPDDPVSEGKIPVSVSCGNWKITYILRDCPEYGLAPGYCILSIE